MATSPDGARRKNRPKNSASTSGGGGAAANTSATWERTAAVEELSRRLDKDQANLLLVGGIWVTLSAASYVIFIGDVMPNGTIPFMTIILVAVFLAYVMILATTMIFQGLAPAITAIVAANLGSQAFIWWISSLHGVRSTVNGMEVVWNSTYLSVLGGQIIAIIGLIAVVFYAQSKKTEFL